MLKSLPSIMNKRLLIIFLFGFSSGLPLALITGTLQAWYADAGMSVLATGMLSLVGLPYAYRIAWGPLLDRYSLLSLGKRRSWILVMQVALLIGFNSLAWFTPQSSPKLMAFLAFLLACFSATQDVAIDAHRIEYLSSSQYGLGASIAMFGYRLALLIASGLALVLAKFGGWEFTYRLMGFLMLPGIIATLVSAEPKKQLIENKNLIKLFMDPVKDLLVRPNIIALVFFILFYKLGEVFTTTTSGIVMPFLIQGMGFSLDTIGYVNKIMGISAILMGGLIAGLILLRCSLFYALLVFGLLQAATNSLFVLLAIVGKNLTLFAITVICDNFATGMGSTALVALFMRLVNQSFTGTQFSLLVAIATLPWIFSGPLGGLLQLRLGWIGLYQIAFILSFGFIPFLYRIKEQTQDVNESDFVKGEKFTVLQ